LNPLIENPNAQATRNEMPGHKLAGLQPIFEAARFNAVMDYKKMGWLAPASSKRGRTETFSDAAIQFCLMVKNLFGLALRQASGKAVLIPIYKQHIGI
jgi:hypothetical protein